MVRYAGSQGQPGDRRGGVHPQRPVRRYGGGRGPGICGMVHGSEEPALGGCDVPVRQHAGPVKARISPKGIP